MVDSLSYASVVVENVTSKIEVRNRTLGEIMLRAVSYYADNYRFSKAFKEGRWDGKIKFGSYTFPYFRCYTGLLPDLLDILKKNGIQPMFTDKRSLMAPSLDIELQFDLRPYQQDVVEACAKHKRGIIKSPTASGKSLIQAAVIQRFKVPTLVTIHNNDILKQLGASYIDALGLEGVGVYGAGMCEQGDVTLATLQTLNSIYTDDRRRFDMMVKPFGLLISDELHHINQNAKAYSKVVEHIPAGYRFGFSATPFRTDRKTATDVTQVALFGDVIADISKQELVEEGFITPVKVLWVQYKHPGIPTSYYGYLEKSETPQEAYRAAFTDCVMNCRERLEAIAEMYELFVTEGKQVLVMVRSVDYAYKLNGILNCPVVHGSTDKEERDEVYRLFKSGELRSLIATDIYSEGVSFEGLDVVILAEPFKSKILTEQRLGRLMRLYKGKAEGILVDFADTTPFFDAQADARLKTYKQQGHQVMDYLVGRR